MVDGDELAELLAPEPIALGFRKVGVSNQKCIAIPGDGTLEQFFVGLESHVARMGPLSPVELSISNANDGVGTRVEVVLYACQCMKGQRGQRFHLWRRTYAVLNPILSRCDDRSAGR